MTRAVALFCLMSLLFLALAWELATPGDDAGDGGPPAPRADVRSAAVERQRTPREGSGEAVLADLAAAIEARPLFSPTRRPDEQPGASAPSAAPEGGPPRLSGVIVGPTGAWAIFAGADGKSRTAVEGDMIGVFKVRAIEPGSVTLSGSEGELTLRPAFIKPPGQSAAVP